MAHEKDVFDVSSAWLHVRRDGDAADAAPSESGASGDAPKLCVVVLNQPVDASLLGPLWAAADLRVVADGGANRLAAAAETSSGSGLFGSALAAPHVVRGDLDSVKDDVLEECRRLGAAVVHDGDQDWHDLHKCLAHVHGCAGDAAAPARPTAAADGGGAGGDGSGDGEASGEKVGVRVVVFGALGGRLDHELANLNSLLIWAPRFADLVFLTPSCLTRALPVGKSRITVAAPFEGPTCGLLPLGAPATRVTTSGLKWNLDAGELAFGALVSSSNEVVAEVVEVDTSAPLLWTAVVPGVEA